MRMGEERLVKHVFESRETGKRKRGRPRKLWKDEARTAAERRGVKWEKIKAVSYTHLDVYKRQLLQTPGEIKWS